MSNVTIGRDRKKQHEDLHKALDELLACFITQNPGKYMTTSTLVEFVWWSDRMRKAPTCDPLHPSVQQRTEEQVAESAEAYGLPTTLHAALEELHEWREAASGMTPAAMRRALIQPTGHERDE
jgi:phage gp46-like protein